MLRHLMMTATAVTLVAAGASAETLRYATARDVYGLDPHASTDSFTNIFTHHIYEPLVRYDADMKIEPALATGWEVIEPTRVRFKLREGVTYQGGQSFGADDVQVSLMRAVDPKSPLRGNLPGLKAVEIVDDLTVDVILEGPTPLLNNYLSNIFIMDKGWLEEHNSVPVIDASQGEEGYTTNNANGTGPFALESRRPDALNVLVVNEGWWDTPQHNLTRIEHSPIGSDATRVAALLSGEIDLIEPAPLQDANRIEATEGVKMLQNPGLRSIMMGINMGDSLIDGNVEGNPLKDVKVRQALYHSINMDLIRDRIMRGKSRVTGSLIAPAVKGYSDAMDARLAYDPEKAKALLAEAGYPEGFAFNLNCPNDRYVNDEAICQAMAAMMAQAGFEPRLVTEPRQMHFQKVDNRQVDVFMLGWATLPMLDGFSVLSAMLASPGGEYGTFTPAGYSNAKVDALTHAVAVEVDEAKRLEMMQEALMLAKADVPWLPLHQQPLSWAARDTVEIPQAADDLVRLWYANVTK
ncbi:peptide/nickel transport system substrate-binding protein [Sulfitobacter brevis]|uniref:Peptide/nickel transport system substrate-binding protein n=1 Tax=Sulfitobacter brevis TaxID=74348 RepID=A0A1I2FT59_9RHOB|nr:ABC transporter substrate-binding protein [Sulfitobacter brevis]SFF08173.1 peptide/nickel transport system substrate-binding protein [Sulfitobacter brevis]